MQNQAKISNQDLGSEQKQNKLLKKILLSLMTVKIFLGILIVATFAICSGYIIGWRHEGEIKNKTAEIINQEAIGENKIAFQNELAIFKKESDVLDKVIEAKNYALCEKAGKPPFCLNFAALLAEDAGYCGKIFEESEKERCLSELAKLKGDYKICDNIKNYIFKNQCYIGAYNNLDDETACELLDKNLTLTTRDQCYFKTALNKKEENLCGQAGEYSDSCYYTLAVEKGDMNICGKIADDNLKNYCYYYNSIKNSFVRPCHLINEDGFQNFCFAEASEKSFYCDEIDDTQLKKYCREMIAYRTNNVELCARNKNCVIALAVKTNEYDLCEELSNYMAVKDCKMTVAVKNKNLDVGDFCLNSNLEAENNCFFNLAVKIGDEKYCKKIKNKEFGEILDVTNDKCFLRLAQTAADMNICNNIKDEPTRD
ncbi:MAG: hypothetical protein U9M94_01480, partial [Patescibacteria group bacterium]|nr:hypothetical protein [Patescibacteria group bacterium]